MTLRHSLQRERRNSEEKQMRNKFFSLVLSTMLSAPCVLAALLFALSLSAEAQQPTKIPRIGFLGTASPSIISVRLEAFRQGLREFGYVEEKSIVIEYRWAEGKFDRLPDLAAELVRLKVDIIVTGGSTSSRAAKEA